MTGETIESTFATLGQHDWARTMGHPREFAGVVGCLESLTVPEIESDPRGMAGNAARCALEVALLDAYGRVFGEPVGRAVELASVPGLRGFPLPGRSATGRRSRQIRGTKSCDRQSSIMRITFTM